MTVFNFYQNSTNYHRSFSLYVIITSPATRTNTIQALPNASFCSSSERTHATMTQQTMSAALLQAAQQIEGKSYTSRSIKEEEVPCVHGMIPIAPSQTASPSIPPSSVPSESFVLPPPIKKEVTSSRSRAVRLEQNRKAARESRRRKKAMVEELQRSLVFFSKSNAALKQQNEILTRQVMAAHSKLAEMGEPLPPLDPKLIEAFKSVVTEVPAIKVEEETNGGRTPAEYDNVAITSMQPGATMQAMASFQQAAQAAMEAATRTMKARGMVVNTDDEVTNTDEV